LYTTSTTTVYGSLDYVWTTSWVSQYWKGKTKTNLDFSQQETVSGSGISWAICKCEPHPRQITTLTPEHSVFNRPDALPAAQPTASKHWGLVYWP